MKPLGFKNYGSIPHLHGSKLGATDKYVHEGQHRICTEKTRDKHDLIIVLEKYDGSNVGVAKKDGKIIALTRSGYLAETSPYAQHHYFAQWVERRRLLFSQILDEGERLTGEWLLQVHGLFYRVVEESDLCVFFDKFNADNKRVAFDDWSDQLYRIGLQIPTLVWHSYGPCSIGDAYNCLLDCDSDRAYSYGPPEGIVYRVERKGEIDFLAKWVRADFEGGKYLPGIGLPEESDEVWNVQPEVLFL